MINRNILDGTNSFRELTEQVNSITDTFTEQGNIFQVVDNIDSNVKSTQKFKLTDDKGLALVNNTSLIRDIKDAGVYILLANKIATMTDKPNNTVASDYILQVIPTNSKDNVIQVLYEARYTNSQAMYYRYVQGSSWSNWQHVQSLDNGANSSYSGEDVREIETPGSYYVQNMEGVPNGFFKGFLTVITLSDSSRLLNLYDEDKKVGYTRVRDKNNTWSEWQKEIKMDDLENAIIGSKDGAMDLLIYSSDSTTFEQAIINYKNETGKGIFNFYVQGGAKGSPIDNSFRGIYFGESNANYGWYIGLDNSSRMIVGSNVSDSFKEPSFPSSEQTIWSGALDMASVDKRQSMYKNIRDFDIVKIYVKYQGNSKFNTGAMSTINNVGHEYYMGGETKFIVQGTLVGSVPASLDFYRCLVVFDGNKFYLASGNTSSSSSGAKYITKIVGKKLTK